MLNFRMYCVFLIFTKSLSCFKCSINKINRYQSFNFVLNSSGVLSIYTRNDKYIILSYCHVNYVLIKQIYKCYVFK